MEPYHHGRRGKDSGVVCGMNRARQTTFLMLMMVAGMALVLVWEAMPFTSSSAVGKPILNRELGSELDELAKSYESRPFLRTVPLSTSKEDNEETDESSSETDSGELTETDSTPNPADTRTKKSIKNASELIPEELTSAEDEQIKKIGEVKGDVNTGRVFVSKNETNKDDIETIAPFESLQRSNETSDRESEDLFLAGTEKAPTVESRLDPTTQHDEPLEIATERIVELTEKSPEERQTADKTTIETRFKERRVSSPLGESAFNHRSLNETGAKAKNLSSTLKDEADNEAEEEPLQTAADEFIESFESQAEKRTHMIINASSKERRTSKPLGESAINHSISNAIDAEEKEVSVAVKNEAEDEDEEEFSKSTANHHIESSGSPTEKQNRTRIENYLNGRHSSKSFGESAFHHSRSNATAGKANHLSTAVKDEAEDEEELLQTAAENYVESTESLVGRRNQTTSETNPKEKRTSKPLGESALNHSSSYAIVAREKNPSTAMKDEAEEGSSKIAAEKFVVLAESPAKKKTTDKETIDVPSKERVISKPLVQSAFNLSGSNVTAAKVKKLSATLEGEVDDESNNVADDVADDAAEEETLVSVAENLVEPSELPAERKTANRTANEAYSKEKITSERLEVPASNHSSSNTADGKPNGPSSTLEDGAAEESEEEPSRTASKKSVEQSELSTEKVSAGNMTTEGYSMERPALKLRAPSATGHSSNATDAKSLLSAMKVEADDVAITQEPNLFEAKNTSQKCDYSVGSWVRDDSRPLYSGLECKMWLSPVFACRLNKHPDKKYDRYRWQPAGCNLPVFNASAVLETLRNKVLAIVGDSLGHQQLLSLLCMLTRGKNTTAVSDVGKQFNFYTLKGGRRPNGYAYRFDATNTTIVFKWTVTLARVQPINTSDPETRNVLHIDRPVKFLENHLHQLDVVVLNSGHHWNGGKMRLNKYDFYHKGKPVELPVSQAYNMTVHNVVHWAHKKTQNTSKIVYYRSLSPRHFRNGDWNTGGTCDTIRFEDDKQVQGGNHLDPNAESAIIGTTVNLLNITSLSLQRGETHVSKYGGVKNGQDCLHWCLPGIPDTWNEILFADLATKLTSTAIAR